MDGLLQRLDWQGSTLKCLLPCICLLYSGSTPGQLAHARLYRRAQAAPPPCRSWHSTVACAPRTITGTWLSWSALRCCAPCPVRWVVGGKRAERTKPRTPVVRPKLPLPGSTSPRDHRRGLVQLSVRYIKATGHRVPYVALAGHFYVGRYAAVDGFLPAWLSPSSIHRVKTPRTCCRP